MAFIRKVFAPDVKRRDFLMRKLTEFRGCAQLDRATKTRLREEIRKCEGYVHYFVNHKGLLIFIGDETMPKKRLLMYKDPLIVQPLIQKIRQQRVQVKESVRRVALNSIGQYWSYSKVNGVLTQPGLFAHKDSEIRRHVVMKAKRPRDEDSYIGIEMEFASKINQTEIAELIAAERLHKSLRVVNDTSIRTDENYPNRAEICVLARYSELDTMLKRINRIITPDLFDANASCGLHVHLDVRNDDVARVYRNLTCMQSLLFKLADNSRQTNQYCRPVQSDDFYSPFDVDHYAAISKSAFYEHGSVEIRIHQSTTNMELIGKWIHLLKRIGDYRGKLVLSNDAGIALEELKMQVKPGAEILKYVEERLAL